MCRPWANTDSDAHFAPGAHSHQNPYADFHTGTHTDSHANADGYTCSDTHTGTYSCPYIGS